MDLKFQKGTFFLGHNYNTMAWLENSIEDLKINWSLKNDNDNDSDNN